MKTPLFLPLFAIALLIGIQDVTAQPLFGVEPFCLAENTLAKVSLPATAIAEMLRSNSDGIALKDACLETPPAGQAQGWQADFDGDGREEMWLLYHSGAADAGCNVLLVVTPAGGGKYNLVELTAMRPGKALLRPIHVLETGMQMYFQTTMKAADGKPETYAAFLAFTQTAVVPLTSWLARNPVIDGKAVTQTINVALADVTFDGRKEVLMQYTYHTGTKMNDKSIIDRYVLALDFSPSNYAYALYDSMSYAKMKEADALAKSGQRQLGRAGTAADGIIKVREALRINPFLTKTRVGLGRYFLNTGRYADAEKTFLDAAEIDPLYPKSYLWLGDTYLRMNDMQKTLGAYQTFLKLEPDSRDSQKVKQNIKKITVPRGRH